MCVCNVLLHISVNIIHYYSHSVCTFFYFISLQAGTEEVQTGATAAAEDQEEEEEEEEEEKDSSAH